MIEIKNRWTGEVIKTVEADTLRGSDLSGSDLSEADLSWSDLRWSDLRWSNLRGSNLSGSDLSGSNLRWSNLRGSNLSRSDLSRSDLSEADLRGSNLRWSTLSWSNLSGSDLSGIREDLFDVLNRAQEEVLGLLTALREGRIDGSVYRGECACLVGTLANVRGCDINALGITQDASSPAERWFLAIRPGDTPENSQIASITAEWIQEWMAEHVGAEA